MYIGVKFCGGCQTKYDRKKAYYELKNKLKNCKFSFIDEEENYDLILVISGCHIDCADISNYISKNGFVHMVSYDENTIEKIIHIIESLQ